MVLYSIDGVYEQKGKEGTLQGKIEVNDNGIIVRGYVRDNNSRAKNRQLKGRVLVLKGLTALDLDVIVHDPNLLNLKYTLTRVNPAEDLSGNYFGVWEPIVKEIDWHHMGGEWKVLQEICHKIAQNGGAIDLPSGDTAYIVQRSFLRPNPKDQITQPGAITLTRTECWRDSGKPGKNVVYSNTP